MHLECNSRVNALAAISPTSLRHLFNPHISPLQPSPHYPTTPSRLPTIHHPIVTLPRCGRVPSHRLARSVRSKYPRAEIRIRRPPRCQPLRCQSLRGGDPADRARVPWVSVEGGCTDGGHQIPLSEAAWRSMVHRRRLQNTQTAPSESDTLPVQPSRDETTPSLRLMRGAFAPQYTLFTVSSAPAQCLCLSPKPRNCKVRRCMDQHPRGADPQRRSSGASMSRRRRGRLVRPTARYCTTGYLVGFRQSRQLRQLRQLRQAML